VQNGMSALPPKADMCSALGDVRFVPIADICTQFREELDLGPTYADRFFPQTRAGKPWGLESTMRHGTPCGIADCR
jgi:hypothetical protein